MGVGHVVGSMAYARTTLGRRRGAKDAQEPQPQRAMTADSEGLTPQSAAGEGNANRDAATQDYLGPEDLDGIPAETAKRLLRAFNRSPSTWVSLIEPDLTTRFIGAS